MTSLSPRSRRLSVSTRSTTILKESKIHYFPFLGTALSLMKVNLEAQSYLRQQLNSTAHEIRNRSTAKAKACCAIRANSRWAMTATPIHNRPTDLGSLLEYLQLYPFSNPKVFDAEVIKPWLKSSDKDISRLKKLINYVALCRTTTIIDLPLREDVIHFLDLSYEEREFYETMMNGIVPKLDEALSDNPLAPERYLNVLRLLNELRLTCNRGLMHTRKESHKTSTNVSQDEPWNKATATKAFQILVSNGAAICKLCAANMATGTSEAEIEEVSKPTLSKCLALICGSCIQNRPGGTEVPICTCSMTCPKFEVSRASETSEPLPAKSLPIIKADQVSTKLNALLESLKEHSGSAKRRVSCIAHSK
jgi:SWI/SNF-related matrix-associated actin-dependent regulator of chromatin subfamily A3